MKYKNYNEIKKQNKRKKIDKVIAGTLCSVVALGAVAGAGYYGYTEYKKLNDEKQQVEIKLDDALKENDALKIEVGETKTQLSSKQAEITTLTEQKVVLLNTVTKIDNEINTTTDKTTLDNLQEKKTAILNQVDDLNSQIASKQAEIDRLQARVEELETNQGGNSEYNIVITQIDQVNTFNGTVHAGYVSGETRTDRKTTIVKNIIGGVVTNISLCDNLDLCDSEGHVLTQATDNYVSYTLSENIESSVYMYDINDRLISINDLVEGKDYTFTIKVDKVVDENGVVVKADTCLYFNETIEETRDYLNYALQFEGLDASSETQDKYFLYLNHSSLQTEGSFEYVVTNASGEVCEEGIATLEFLDEENRMNIVFVDNITGEQNISTYVMDTYDSIGVSFDFHSDGDNEDITFTLIQE